MMVSIKDLKEKTGVGFGTSGIRALATKLTDEVVFAYTKAFIEYLRKINEIEDRIAVAGDLRESTDRLMRTVAGAIVDSGLIVVNCGKIPTPAVTFYGIQEKIPSIMVTGSHIPAERNGIKFNRRNGEILKSDEAKISEMEIEVNEIKKVELPAVDDRARKKYVGRYAGMFPSDFLKGKTIGLYGHSAVGREITEEVLANFGAKVERLEFASHFILIDTEVINDELINKGRSWTNKYLAIVSTDGDGDRPLIAGNDGKWLKSDVLGIWVAKYLGAKTVVAPISCNTALEKSGFFEKVIRTKIGSPYVVEEMNKCNEAVAYEANGGFLTKELPTRDALIVILSILAQLPNLPELPKRFTNSSSIKGQIVLREDWILQKLATWGEIKDVNRLDGLRVIFENEEIVHLRQSRNSPELRDYCEAGNEERAKELSRKVHDMIGEWNK